MIETETIILFTTARLTISPVKLSDAPFLLELMNSPGWLKFIGDRNVPTLEATQVYIKNINHNPNINYLVVRNKETKASIGIVTLIKREYLEHWDIGFAFLPGFTGNGFAHEATQGLIEWATKRKGHRVLLATTLKNNVSSIKLLEKLGLRFSKEIRWQGESLQLFTTGSN